jgi:two-component system cell cycle response regulator
MPGRILIVDDVATNRVILRVKLTAARYNVVEAVDGAEALERARSERPDLILMDLSMPGLDGMEVCRRLKADPETAQIPVVIFSAYPDPSTKLRVLEAGAEEFMSKPLDEMALMARIRSLLRASHTKEELSLRDSTSRALGLVEDSAPATQSPARVTLVAGDTATARQWHDLLKDRLPDNLQIRTREAALTEERSSDLYMIACDLSGPAVGDGLHMIPELRAHAGTRQAAIVVVLSEASRKHAAMALDLGATDIVVGPLDGEEIALRLGTHLRRKRDADRLRKRLADGLELAVTDPLTGLYNRRYAMTHLTRVRKRARETGRSFAVMMLDLDRFKSVNDLHGHLAGDAVLRAVAERLKGNLRGVDLLARLGGEEFLAILPDCDATAATRAAERLRNIVQATPIELPKATKGTLRELIQTVSIGVVVVGRTGDTDTPLLVCASEDDLLEQADKALYRAKSAGRNSITVGQMAA